MPREQLLGLLDQIGRALVGSGGDDRPARAVAERIRLVNADPPISEAERDFLTSVRPHLAKRSRFDQFERELRRFLQRAKGQMLLQSAAGKASRLLADLRSRAELERRALEMDLQELAAKAEAFQRHLDDVERARFEDKAVLRAQVERLVAEFIDARLEAFQSENLPKMRAALADAAREHQQVSPSKFRDGFRGQAMRIIEEALLTWGGAEEAQLADALKGLLRRFTEQTNALLGRIAADCQALFGVSFDLFLPEEELPADRGFSVADWFVADGIDLALGVAMNVMPRAFVRRRILAEVNRGMAEKLNMQCGRLRYDFVRRIQERVQEFTAAMDAYFARAITGIRDVVERGLSLRRDREEAAAAARAQVTGRLAESEDMESRLATVVNRIEGDAVWTSGSDSSGKSAQLQIPSTAEYVRP